MWAFFFLFLLFVFFCIDTFSILGLRLHRQGNHPRDGPLFCAQKEPWLVIILSLCQGAEGMQKFVPLRACASGPVPPPHGFGIQTNRATCRSCGDVQCLCLCLPMEATRVFLVPLRISCVSIARSLMMRLGWMMGWGGGATLSGTNVETSNALLCLFFFFGTC